MENLTIQLPGRLLSVEALTGPGEEEEMAAAARRQMQAELQADKARIAQALAALGAAAGQLAQVQADLLAEVESAVAQLAVEVARKVLMQEIQAGRYEIDPIVREALRHVPSRGEVAVHLNPADHARCELAAQAGLGAGRLRFVADAGVAPGECRLETKEGVVTSRIEADLQAVAETLGMAEQQP